MFTHKQMMREIQDDITKNNNLKKKYHIKVDKDPRNQQFSKKVNQFCFEVNAFNQYKQKQNIDEVLNHHYHIRPRQKKCLMHDDHNFDEVDVSDEDGGGTDESKQSIPEQKI